MKPFRNNLDPHNVTNATYFECDKSSGVSHLENTTINSSIDPNKTSLNYVLQKCLTLCNDYDKKD